MNLNQAAHGGCQAKFIHTRMRLNRKVVVGHCRQKCIGRLDAHRAGLE